MELNNPIKSKIYIITVVILLFLGVISLFINLTLSKTNVSKSVDVYKLIKDDSYLNDYFNKKKIPIDILKNIDKDKCNKLSNELINNLYSGTNPLINSVDVKSLIIDSVYEYENKTGEDIYSNISYDLSELVETIVNTINNEENINRFNIVNNATYMYLLLIPLSVVFFVLMSLKEKNNFLIIGGIICIAISLFLIYIKTQLIDVLYNNLEIIDILNMDLKTNSSKSVNIICGIILVVGIIMIAIKLIIEGRHTYRKIRTSYLDKYY